MGAGGGALLGGVLGQAIGHNTTGTLIGASVGALGGYFVGSLIGRQLDTQDRARAEAATQQALAGGSTRPVSWTSHENLGVRGSTQVVAVHRQADGSQCKSVREIAYIKGQQVSQPSTYCRTADGGWAAQA